MQRESSTSDWDVVGDAEIASMPQRENTGSDDFFSSGQFHRVELNDFSTPSVEDGTGAMIHTNPAAPMRHRLPGVLSNHITAGSDADIESPMGVRRHQSNNPNPPTDSCTPTTPSTAGSALVPPSGSNSASRPHHLQLDEGRDMSSEMHQGFPSTASVDSVFQGGCFTHFSPQKLLVTTGSHGNMHPSYSSSSVATPTSPPPPRSTFPRGAASPPQVRIAASSPFLASPGGDGTGVKPPMASHQGASVARGAPNSFRPPLVPKLNFAATNGAESPSASQAPRPSAFLLACLTPRIPILLKSGISPSNGGEGILTDAQHATLRWENPTQSLVRWTMALLTLDVLHTFTTFDAGYTWTTLFGRTMVLLMVCGRLFRATQDSQNDALVSGATFAERLKQVVAERADDWANNAAVAVHGCVNTVVLDGQEAAHFLCCAKDHLTCFAGGRCNCYLLCVVVVQRCESSR
ncbi:Hypothetical protein, putative [Bodo saltans]|uniref:Uncharacterized protein n=1 Tax=Bodo saltans TaxID=75058 RepID=A0A0S4J5B2_BODSA|nr:Hypothetical protein, putative [Bodo saltans]|eukprot:CUG54243.1 Hypothetical protein, putative [Bodo saltans]